MLQQAEVGVYGGDHIPCADLLLVELLADRLEDAFRTLTVRLEDAAASLECLLGRLAEVVVHGAEPPRLVADRDAPLADLRLRIGTERFLFDDARRLLQTPNDFPADVPWSFLAPFGWNDVHAHAELLVGDRDPMSAEADGNVPGCFSSMPRLTMPMTSVRRSRMMPGTGSSSFSIRIWVAPFAHRSPPSSRRAKPSTI